jgi:S-adenosylmethionine synthetase
MDNNSVEVRAIIHEQSPEIAQGVDSDDISEQGTGDQGLMFGISSSVSLQAKPNIRP